VKLHGALYHAAQGDAAVARAALEGAVEALGWEIIVIGPPSGATVEVAKERPPLRRLGLVQAEAALGIVAFNAVLLLALAWAAVRHTPRSEIGAILAYAVVLAGIGQLAVVVAGFFRLRRGPRRLRFGMSTDTRRFFALALPGLIAAGIPQLKLIAGAMVASSSQAGVSWLYYANRLYE